MGAAPAPSAATKYRSIDEVNAVRVRYWTSIGRGKCHNSDKFLTALAPEEGIKIID